MDFRPLTALLIEDNPGDVRLMQELLSEERTPGLVIETAENLAHGLERLHLGSFDVVLLDLGLPDSEGMDTLSGVREYAPETPVVVLTVQNDEVTAIRALQAGAQDYLVKGELDAKVLIRSIRYAVERLRLLIELDRARHAEQQEREFRSLARFAPADSVSITAKMYGKTPLKDELPHSFDELVKRYMRILGLAVESKAYKVDHPVSAGLRQIGQDLGFLKAGPRDVIDIHQAALQEKTEELGGADLRICIEESRFLVLELMGNLAAHYRDYYACCAPDEGTGTRKTSPAVPTFSEEA